MGRNKRKLGPNLSVEEWVLDPKNLIDGLHQVQFNDNRIFPVKNSLCPRCDKGWANNPVFAVFRNTLFHHACLEKRLGKKKFAKFLELGYIATEAAPVT